MSALVKEALEREISTLNAGIKLSRRAYELLEGCPQAQWRQHCHTERLVQQRAEIQAFINVHLKEI